MREFAAGVFLDERLELLDDLFEVAHGEFRIFNFGVIPAVFQLVDHDLERLIVFTGALLHAHDHIAVHLNKPAVAIPREPFVLRGCDERENGGIVETEIQNRIHHARHRIARTGAYGDEQRHRRLVAELRAYDFFDVRDAVPDACFERLRIGLFIFVVISADFGGDGQPRRYRQADARHFREVGTFTAEQRLH